MPRASCASRTRNRSDAPERESAAILGAQAEGERWREHEARRTAVQPVDDHDDVPVEPHARHVARVAARAGRIP